MFSPNCLPVLIGSLPLSNHRQAAALVFRYTPEIPLWPQLPAFSREGMVRQFISGFPGLIDSGKKYWVDSLYRTWRMQLDTVCALGFSKQQITAQTMIAPACGTGSLSPELAEKVLSMTRGLADQIRKDFALILPANQSSRA